MIVIFGFSPAGTVPVGLDSIPFSGLSRNTLGEGDPFRMSHLVPASTSIASVSKRRPHAPGQVGNNSNTQVGSPQRLRACSPSSGIFSS